MDKKTKKWWQHLLIIPITAVADAILLVIALIIDGSMGTPQGQGHPAPAITIITALILAVVSAVLIIRGIILAVKSLLPRKEQQSAESVQKPVWRCFIPLIVQIVLSAVLVVIVGTNEINAFYNNPDHIGFAIPIGTFMLAGILLILAVVTLIITIIAAGRRSKNNTLAQNKAQERTKQEDTLCQQ